MESQFYTTLTEKSLKNEMLSREECLTILTDSTIDRLSLLNAAYHVRHTYFKNDVSIHIINNAKNGHCPEDCKYCVQGQSASTEIADYPMKSDEEILEEAKQAHESGAFRYCMVFSGRGPSKKRVERLSRLIANIKSTYPIEVCLSPGLINDLDAESLKSAGLDRLNHNLNTSETHYNKICSTHTYEDRKNTLNSAKKAGISICSGLIVGMGESNDDICEVLSELHTLKAASIPVNFFIPLQGTALSQVVNPISSLTPDYCLRVLCLARFLNPKSEIRIAAGRDGLHVQRA